MIQSSFVENRSALFRVLSDDQVWEIKQAAFDVLEKMGCNVLHEGAAKLLKKAGAIVKGAPCFLGGNVGVFDMGTGNMSVAAWVTK